MDRSVIALTWRKASGGIAPSRRGRGAEGGRGSPWRGGTSWAAGPLGWARETPPGRGGGGGGGGGGMGGRRGGGGGGGGEGLPGRIGIGGGAASRQGRARPCPRLLYRSFQASGQHLAEGPRPEGELSVTHLRVEVEAV